MNIDLDKVPATIEDAIDILYASITEDELTEIKKSTPEKYHHTVGRYLRNEWSFWQDTPLKRDFIARFKLFGHGDDLSGVILAGLCAKCLGQNVTETIQNKVDSYREHWSYWGLNPETGELVKEMPVNCIYYFNIDKK